MDVAQLTDVELREQLKGFGLQVGPIVASTRKVYEKKLLKFITNGSANDSTLNDSAVISSPVKSKKATSPAAKSPAKSPVREPTPEDVVEQSDSDDYEGEESMRYLTEEEMAADRAAMRQAQRSSGGGFGNVFYFTLLIATLAVFAYFLIENAEQLKLVTDPKQSDDQV